MRNALNLLVDKASVHQYIYGRTGVDTANRASYNEAITQEPRIKALRDKVSIEFKSDWEHSLAEMAIQLDDGTTLEASHDSGIPWSDPGQRYGTFQRRFFAGSVPNTGKKTARNLANATETAAMKPVWITRKPVQP